MWKITIALNPCQWYFSDTIGTLEVGPIEDQLKDDRGFSFPMLDTLWVTAWIMALHLEAVKTAADFADSGTEPREIETISFVTI